jgi:cytochrome c-type biogenesis protein
VQDLLTHLTHAIEGTPAIALSAAVLWGIFSILLSPCHLASIPLIVGFVGEQGTITTRRAFLLSLLFATGILVTIAIIGILTASAGRMLGDLGPFANYAVALIFFVVGLHLLGVIPLPLPSAAQTNYQRKGLVAAFVLGLVFGIALGPCTFAYMAPMLAIAFKVSSDQALYGALLLLAYGVGHCGVIVLAGTSTEWVEHLLHWNNNSRGTLWLKRICGLLVLLGGLWLLYTAP